MAFTLEVHFTGLCAFVPGKPIDQDENHATVLMVNARRSHHGAHHSVLLAKPEVYPDASNRPEFARFKILDSSLITVKACALSGEQLDIVGLKEDGTRVFLTPDKLKFVHGFRKDDVCPKSGDQKTDFAWVLTNPGKINPDLLTGFDCGDVVSMRMNLTWGKLRTDLFRTDDRNRIIKWNFGKQIAAAAEEVVYELPFDNATAIKSVAFESTGFSGSPLQEPLRLTPTVENETVKVWIANMPLGDILRLAEPLFYEPDHHYGEYYRLCYDSPPRLTPIPNTIDFCQGFGAISNPKCPPTQFAPPEIQFSNSATTTIEHKHHGGGFS